MSGYGKLILQTTITARDASKIVGLSGDKYKIFAEVCRELGLDFSAKKKEQEVVND